MSTEKAPESTGSEKSSSQLQLLTEEDKVKDSTKVSERLDDDNDSSDSDFEHLSRQLTLLNEESGSLATPIHKSNQQKIQEIVKNEREAVRKRNSPYKSPAKKFGFFQGRGIKRSPSKPIIGIRKPKRKKLKLKPYSDDEPDDDDNDGDDGNDEDNGDDVNESEHEGNKKKKDIKRKEKFKKDIVKGENGKKETEETGAETGAEGDLENSDSDSDDDDQWQIIEDSETEIDKALEDRAQKNHLTARNVKSILHQVITNEDVVAMVRNTLMKEQGEEIEPGQAVYEPKMTRSKVKQTIEENGQVLHPWPLTPLKKQQKKTFLDMDLTDSEAESDADFDPTLQPSSFSDEDSESMASSHLSELGSPSTPATPRSTTASVSDLDKTPSVRGEGEQVILSPMGPPVTPFAHRKSLGRKFQEAMAENDRVQEEENIARRTRSKVSLEDTSILDLEANFVPPDFTPDMYDTECYLEDDIYRGFLTSLIKPPENENTNDTVDDEENDPEFNILDELDKIKGVTTKDREKDEMRNDRGVQVSKKEMNQLMDELFEFYEETADWEDEDDKDAKCNVSKAKTQLKKKWLETGYDSPSEEFADVMSVSQRQQLADQMRKHVQLLTQTFLLASGNQDQYSNIATSSKVLLNELHTFKVQNSTFMTSNSAYCAGNLDAATQLVNEDRGWELHPSEKKKNKTVKNPQRSIASTLMKNYNQLTRFQKDKILEIVEEPSSKSNFDSHLAKLLPELSPQQKDIIWKSPVFMYPELLPSFAFISGKAAPQRVTFTESEDNLIALGIEQFEKLPLFRNLIQKFLIPVKTAEQIKIRIKNLACSKATDNAVKFYRMKKKLPPFPRFTGKFEPENMTAPRDQNIHSLPHWCKEVKIQEILGLREERADLHGNIQRSRSVPLVTADKVVVEEEKSNSAPATPLTQSSSLGSRPTPGVAVRKLNPDTPLELFSSPVIYTPIKTPTLTPDVLVTPSCHDSGLSKNTCVNVTDTKCSSRTSLNFGDEDLPPLVSAVSNPSKDSINEVENSLLNLEDFMPDASDENRPDKQVHVTLTLDRQDTIKDASKDISQSPSNVTTSASEEVMSQKDIISVENDTLSNHSGTVNASTSPATTYSPVKNVLSLTQSGSTLIMSIAESDKHMDCQSSLVVCDSNRLEDSPAVSSSNTIVQSNNEQRSIEPSSLSESQDLQVSEDHSMSNDSSGFRSSLCATETSVPDTGANNIGAKLGKDSQILHDKVTQSNAAMCHTKGSITSSSEVRSPALDNVPPVKSALEIVASYAKYMVSPTKNISLSQKSQETTPKKKTPTTRYRPLAPKPTTSPIRPAQPIIFEKKSPRRQQLQRKAQAICPKGLVVKTMVSPSKKAADIIMNKVLRRGNRRILPKPLHMPSPQLTIRTRSSSRRQLEMTSHETDEENMETNSECDTAIDSEYLSDDGMDDIDKLDTKGPKSFRHHSLSESGKSVESDDLQSDNDDSQTEDNDEELMADLMTASTTIGFSQKKPSMSKYKRRKEIALSLLAPNIVEDDPLADDRDTSFAQAYLAMARDTLKNDLGVYEQFLRVLCELGKGDQSPVKLFSDLTEVLEQYPDLIHDFAGFLLPHQAVQCGCFMANQEFTRARSFLRKLEIYFEKNPGNYQKVIKILSRWSQLKVRDPGELREAIEPLFKAQPHLMEQFSLFFVDARPPESMMTDFEEITFEDSDEDIEDLSHDGFEDLILPEEEEPIGTKKCQCSCHNNPRLINFYKRNKHCYSCCLKVINGELYYKINKQVIRRVKVTRHKAIKAKGSNPEPEVDIPSQPPQLETIAWMDEDEAEKENVNVLPKSKSKQFGIKLKISSKKKGKQKRFYSLKEMTESPVKQEIPCFSVDGLSGSESTQHAPETALHTVPNIDANKTFAYQERLTPTPGIGNNMGEVSTTPHDVSDSDGTASGVSAGSENSSANSNLQLNPELRIDNVGNTQAFIPPTEESASGDLLAKALKEAMISQSDVTLDGSLLCQSPLKNPEKSTSQISSMVEIRENVKMDYSMKEQTSANDKVYKGDQSDVPNFTDIKDKKISTGISQSLISVTTEKKTETSPVNMNTTAVTHSACTPSEKRRIIPIPVPEDKLCMSPAFMVPSSEDSVHSIKSPASSGPVITYTNSPMLQSDISSDTASKSSCQSQKCLQKPVFSPPNQPFNTSTIKRKSPTDIKSNDGAREERKFHKDESASKEAPSPCSNSNQSWCSDSNRTIISSVIGFGSEASNTSTHSLEGRISGDKGSNKVAEQNSKDKESAEIDWTRDHDRLILETVKKLGPGSTTFDTISKDIPGRSAAQVLSRFHHLLEMLAEDETPSEGETSGTSSS